MPDLKGRHFDPLLALRLTFLGLMLVVLTRTQADPDLWGHVLFGRDIVAQRAIPAADHYSFTSDRPWINHEWLSEVSMYSAYALAGSSGLSLLKLALVTAAIAVVLWTLRVNGMPPALHDALVFLTIAGIAPLATHIRPEMFSLLLFTVMLALLTVAAQGATTVLIWIPMVVLLWVNLHGGWLVGMGTFGLWAGGESLRPDATWRTRACLAAVVVVTVGASLANPYGYQTWVFLRETVGLGRSDISEWLPVYQLGPGMILLWSLLAVVATVSCLASALRPRLSAVAVVAVLGYASFRVGRLIGFFAVAVAILLAPQLASAWRRRRATDRPRQPTTTLGSALVLGVAIVAMAGSLFTMYRNLACVRMEPDWSPEPEAANFVTSNRLHGRMVTWFDWGEYAIWHFAPAIQVSMDGRRETVYSEAVRNKHLGFFFNVPADRAYATELNADYVWIPRTLAIVPALEQQGWTPIFTGPRSMIFAKVGTDRSFRTEPDASPASGCFPGP